MSTAARKSGAGVKPAPAAEQENPPTGSAVPASAPAEQTITSPAAETAGSRHPRPLRILRARLAVVVIILAAYTVACVLVPDLRISLYSPDLRTVIEIVGLCVALFAALALMLPNEEGKVDHTSSAFIVALITLGLSNAIFGIGPILLGGDTATGSGFTFYPWLVARYVTGLLFIVATLNAPQLSLRAYLLLTGVALAVTNAAVYMFRDRLPVPLLVAEVEQARGGMAVDVSSILTLIGAIAVPAALFVVGAWLAWKVYLRSASSFYVWLSLALWVQVLVHVHESLYPAILGPAITSADLLQAFVLLVLLIGAVLQVRTLFSSHSAALRGQAADLRAQRQLLNVMRDFTEREEAFRSIVIHELATPIATLRGFSRLLSSPAGTFSEEAREEALRGVASESNRLQMLVERMEELRSLELDRFRCDLRSMLLYPLLSDAALYVSGLPGGHHVLVSCGHDIRVQADPVRLGQALRNLLTNAARYSPDRSPILLEGREGPDGWVRIVVSDDGPGLPSQERERVLGKYERGSAGLSEEGAGLGLYVAQRIAAAHRGQMYFTDPQVLSGARAVLEVRTAT